MKKFQIFTVPEYRGNAFIVETAECSNRGSEFVWGAPLLKDDTVDHTQWGSIEDSGHIHIIADSNQKIFLDEIAVTDFNKLINTGQEEV
tara:strand:+ start:264 stop:530 length:267 start_codon:yes stop_codon:yes gene_type:complete